MGGDKAGELPVQSFRELACARYGWKGHAFVGRTFLHCVLPWQRPVVWLLRPFWERFYRPDLRIIEKVADMTSYNDVYQVAQDFADSRRDRNLFRDRLGIRPHGRRLLAMARDSLPGRASRHSGVGGGPAGG